MIRKHWSLEMRIGFKLLFLSALWLMIAGLPANTCAGIKFEKLGGTMMAFGEIAGGDYRRFVEEYLGWEAPPTVFAFDSTGGNVIEAIAIANFVRSSRVPIWITGKCYSACALIYLAAPSRTATGEIGLHRTYYDQSFFAGLSSYKAEAEYKMLEALTGSFLADIGVDKRIIEIMKSVPSDKMIVYRGRAETSEHLKDESTFMEEWRIAKCGSVDDTALLASCAFNWLQHIYLNYNLVEGWEEKFMKDQDGEFKKSMPTMCQPIMKDSEVLSLKALRDSELLGAIKVYSKVVKERGQCISKAEDSEVWGFFRTLKNSKEAAAFFLRPALDIVLEKYGR